MEEGYNVSQMLPSGKHLRTVVLRIVVFQISILFFCMVPAMLIVSQDARATDWGIEQEISTDIGAEWQLWPKIATDGTNVHVVWVGEGDGDRDIYYRYFNGTDWEPELEVSTDIASEQQSYPSIAVEDGKVHVMWHVWEDGDWDIHYRYFNGTDWEPELEVSTDTTGEWQRYPSIAVSSGRVYATWEFSEDWMSGDADIHYRYFNGTDWEPEQEISTDIGMEYQGEPSIAVYEDKVHVVWHDQRDGDQDIYYRCFNGTSWQPEEEISTDSMIEWQWRPEIAAGGGDVHVVWTDEGDGDADVYYRFFNGTDWEPEQEISNDSGSEWQGDPSIGVDGGKIHIVWQDRGDGDADVYYRFFNGTDWEPEQQISIDVETEREEDPSIAVSGSGIHVVWEDQGDGDQDIFYRRGEIRDVSLPESSAKSVSPFWQTTLRFDVEWVARDNIGLSNISLFYRHSPDNSSWSSWEEWTHDDTISGFFAIGAFSFDSPHGDGFYEFYTIAIDASGNAEMPPLSADAVMGVDTAPPTGSIIINDGDVWATSTSVTLTLTYFDALSGVSYVRHGDDGMWDSEPWELPSTTRLWPLEGEDGMKYVYYQVRDDAGMVSFTYLDDIVLDTTPPTIVHMLPSDGTTDVEVSANIIVTFSEKMNESVTANSLSLEQDGAEIEGTTTWINEQETLIFDPVGDLEEGATFRISITSEARDVAGNGLVTPIETHFTTKGVEKEPLLGEFWWIILLMVFFCIFILVIFWRRRKERRDDEEDAKKESVTNR